MRALKDFLTPLAIFALAGVLLYDHLSPHNTTPVDPAVNGAALGKAYGPVLVATYADGWLAAASAIEEGKTIAEAQKALQDAWKDGRVKAFQAEVQPGFSLVLPEGTEPSDPAKRAQVADLWRSFARGLKGGKR